MRLTRSEKLLLVAAAATMTIGFSGITSPEQPTAARDLTLVIEDSGTVVPVTYECTYASLPQS